MCPKVHQTCPVLPAELERQIFEISAHSHPLSIPNFMLVAWRIKIWVEPLLYRIIVWSRTVKAMNALPIARGVHFFIAIEKKPTTFLRLNVRHLMLETGGKGGIALLAACRGVEDLWLGGRHVPGALFPLVEDLPLKRLSCYLGHLFGSPSRIDFSHQLFARITHLAISDYVHRVDPKSLAQSCTHSASHPPFIRPTDFPCRMPRAAPELPFSACSRRARA
ncbi:hypothetical protein MVEN_01152500 [Mycena venus]|uniref:Uncharacterized protein n=1 Tax=Mycena venus TaxID=2733690 RepID=A0A8H6Y263_9AGAR|nr:hypothetical protein MVEN_01152500 [Mycena venus]